MRISDWSSDVCSSDLNVARLDQRAFDLEAGGCGDVFEVDATKGRADARDGVDEFLRVPGIDLDIEHVDIGKFLEQYGLALHHRLAGERDAVAQGQHGGAVGNHRDQITLGCIAVGVGRIGLDGQHRLVDAGNVGTGRDYGSDRKSKRLNSRYVYATRITSLAGKKK